MFYVVFTIKSSLLVIVVVVFGFNVSSTATVIWRRDLGFKSHPKDWRSPVSNHDSWFTMRVTLLLLPYVVVN